MSTHWEDKLHPHERVELADIRRRRTTASEEVRLLIAKEKTLYDRARKRKDKKENANGGS